jgi:hypothetical protein
VKKGQEVLLSKDREQIECLINQIQRKGRQFNSASDSNWSKLDIEEEYAASVTTRLSNMIEKLAAAIAKAES